MSRRRRHGAPKETKSTHEPRAKRQGWRIILAVEEWKSKARDADLGGTARANALADYCLCEKPRDQLAEHGRLRRERSRRNARTPAVETIDNPRPTSRNEGTADAIGALRGTLGPDLFEIDAYRRKDGNVQ